MLAAKEWKKNLIQREMDRLGYGLDGNGMGWKTLEAQPKRGVQSGVYAGKRKEIGAEAERCNPLSSLPRNERNVKEK